MRRSRLLPSLFRSTTEQRIDWTSMSLMEDMVRFVASLESRRRSEWGEEGEEGDAASVRHVPFSPSLREKQTTLSEC